VTKTDYWAESLASSFEEHGITATTAQIEAIARDLEISRDNMGMAFHVPENPLIGELARTQAALKLEKSLVHCKRCNGAGRLVSHFGTFQSDSQCWKCHGEGKHKP
jgi:hypothetical protein